MAAEFPGWMTAYQAAKHLGMDYATVRTLANAGVFTKGQFSASEKRPPIYLRVVELDAFRSGGVPAVVPLKAEYARTQRTAVAATEAPAGA
jgi:hypothetical protein